MPGAKYHKCKQHGSCSDESTDCDECHGKNNPRYHEECPPKCCHTYKKGMGAHKIMCQYRDAVVTIYGEFHFTQSVNPALNPPVGLSYTTTPGIGAATLETVYTHGNGFFVDQHLIICPANLVLAPPDSTLAYNRWPFSANRIVAANFQSDIMTRANRIFVDVSNVNGGTHTCTYQADIIGVYGFGDIAILYIDSDAVWNTGVPCIKKCHPHFRFACSRRYRDGLPIYAIGNLGTRSLGGFAQSNSNSSLNSNQGKGIFEGVIVHSRHTDHIGYANQELIVVDLQVYAHSTGLPLINAYGHVIGMTTMNVTGATTASDSVQNVLSNPNFYNPPNGDGYVAGPSQFFMLDVIRTILCSMRSRNSHYIQTVSDLAGDYIRYIHGFLGLAYEIADGQHFMSYRDPTTGRIYTRFDPANPGMYLTTPPLGKEVIGVRVAGLTNDGTNAAVAANRFRGDIYLPGVNASGPAAGSVVASPWVASPLNVALNDVITHFEELALGDEEANEQIPPLLFTSRKKVGDSFLMQSYTYASGYENQVIQTVTTVAAPRFYDYPWYKYWQYPWMELSQYGTFFDHPLPQDPTVAGSHPVDASLDVYTIPVI